jgi:hypothetical protein
MQFRSTLTALFASIASLLFAQDCVDGYDYHRVFTVTPPAGATQVEAGTHALPFETASLVEAGKLRTDGNDLRITDAACNPLPFYIQSVELRDTNALYIALPPLTEDGMEIHIYYGQPDEEQSLSAGEEVFLFFDDFEDGVIDESRWETVGSYVTYEESDGSLLYSGDTSHGGIFQYFTPNVGTSNPVTFDFVANANNFRIYGIADTSDVQRIAFRYGAGSESIDSLNIIAQMSDTLSGGFNPGLVYPDIIVPRVEMQIISMSAERGPNGELVMTRFMNLSNLDANLDTTVLDAYGFDALRPFFSAFAGNIEVEFFGARNTPSALLEVASSEETFIGVSSTEEMLLAPFRLFPNPSDGVVHIQTELPQVQQVQVSDIQGRILMQVPYQARLDLSTLSSGHYHIQLISEEGLSPARGFIRR